MTFTRRKKAPEGAAKPEVKMHVVSVRLTDEQYQTVVENCRLSGRNIAEELTAISGDCTEIKQAQLTAATTDDLKNADITCIRLY